MKKRFIIEKALFQIFVIVIAIFAFSYFINPVSAAEPIGCCESAKDGATCIETTQSNCNEDIYHYTDCSDIPQCSAVCCQDSLGQCLSSVSKTTCEVNGGTVLSQGSCVGIEQCELGCCIIGSQYTYTTEQACNKLIPGTTPEFRKVLLEEECKNLQEAKVKGCCETSGIFEYKTKDSCLGTFYEGQLCSQIAQNCQSHSYTDCVNGNVYWFDSCGNQEEIDINCNYIQTGKICVRKGNKAECSDLNCEDVYTNKKFPHLKSSRENGESWCVYESPVGDFMDFPGTIHYVHSCINGQEIVEPCEDFRRQVCIENWDEDFSQARCIDNEVFDSPFTEAVTTVPKGFEFWADDEIIKGNNQEICTKGSSTTQVFYAKKSDADDWDCVANCHAENPLYVLSMVEQCKAQGDCGADFNVLEKYSDRGIKVFWTGTSKGPKPIPDENAYRDLWLNYEVGESLKNLSELFNFIPDSRFSLKYEDIGLDIAKTVGIGIPVALASWGMLVSSSGASWFSVAYGLSFIPVWGWIVLAAILILTAIIGNPDQTSKTLVIACDPWQPHTGGEDCDKCTDQEKLNKLLNNDGTQFNTCTEYRCRSLGKNCVFEPSNNQCIDKNPYDTNSPIISPHTNLSIRESARGYRIPTSFPPFEPFIIGIKTDEASQCYYSFEPRTDIIDMKDVFGSGDDELIHELETQLPEGQSYTYYIKCEDSSGNYNKIDYAISLDIKKGKDVEPPRVIKTEPRNNALLPSFLDNAPFITYLNEPAKCKWDKISKSYSLMSYYFACELEEKLTPPFEYPCTAAFLNLTTGENTFYYACNDTLGNYNRDIQTITLIKTESLEISSLEPEGDVEYNDVTLHVTTNQKSKCSFQLKPYQRMIPFINTDATEHTTSQTNLQKGDYTYEIYCMDEAGNEITENLEFTVTGDIEPPKLIYTYKDQNNIYVVLNEASDCTANNKQMSDPGSTIHSTSLTTFSFNIDCKDLEGNQIKKFTIYP